MKSLIHIAFIVLTILFAGCQSSRTTKTTPKLKVISFSVQQAPDKVIVDIERDVASAISVALNPDSNIPLGKPTRKIIVEPVTTDGMTEWTEEWTYSNTGSKSWIVNLKSDESGYRFFKVEEK